jgi:hypothetical protein
LSLISPVLAKIALLFQGKSIPGTGQEALYAEGFLCALTAGERGAEGAAAPHPAAQQGGQQPAVPGEASWVCLTLFDFV